MYDQYGNKLVRKAIPYQLYDIAGLQQWFEEMSAKGWILDGFGIRTAVFHQDKPAPGVRYRLEPQSYWDTSIDYEKNEAYAQMGWEFVDTVTRYYYIYRAADPETEELHTDPVTQSYVFDHYLKYFFRFFCAGVVILLGQAAYTLGFDRSALTLSLSGFLEDLVLDTQYIVPLLLADLWALLVITPIYYFRFLKIWKLRNQLAAGVPLDAGQRYPRSTASTVAFFAVPVVLFFLSFLGILLPPSEKASLTPDQPTPAPLVSLYDLELNPAIQDPEFRSNLVETSSSPLAVKQTLSQWTDWEEPDDPTASISVDYVDAVSSTCAGWVLDSWKRTDEVEDGIPWQEASRPGLDRLYTYIEVPEGPAEYDVGDHHYTVNQFADTYYWMGQAGDRVFRLTVRGTVPPEEALDLLLERMGTAP